MNLDDVPAAARSFSDRGLLQDAHRALMARATWRPRRRQSRHPDRRVLVRVLTKTLDRANEAVQGMQPLTVTIGDESQGAYRTHGLPALVRGVPTAVDVGASG